jgi:hypothetical protein
MNDAVLAADGQTYERSAVQQWIQQGRNGWVLSLLIQEQLQNLNFMPNYTLKKAIKEWREAKKCATRGSIIRSG